MDIMKFVRTLSFILVIVGALNWGLVGLMDVNLVTLLLGHFPMLVKIVYILVGVGAVVVLMHCRDCANCKK